MSALGPYSTLLIPAIVAVGLIWLALRIAKAIIHLIVVVLVILLLVWGYTEYQHVAALQTAAQNLAHQANSGNAGAAGSYGATATAVLARARAILSQAGLDPTTIQATVQCANGSAVLVLRDTQANGLLALLGNSAVQVPLSPAIHCTGTT